MAFVGRELHAADSMTANRLKHDGPTIILSRSGIEPYEGKMGRNTEDGVPAMLATNSAPMRLHELLKSMCGKDLAQMSKDWRESYLADTASKFSVACEALPELLLGERTVDRMWLWQCEPGADPGSEVVASFSLVKIDQVEAEPRDAFAAQMAVALAPGMRIGLDLLAEDSGVRGFGDVDAKPKLRIVVVASGGPELMIAEAYLQALKDDFPAGVTGLRTHVASGQGVSSDIVNPPDVHAAFQHAADAARLADEEQAQHARGTQSAFVEIEADAQVSVIELHRALGVMGQFFTATAQALRYS